MNRQFFRQLAFPVAALALAACSGTTDSPNGTVNLKVQLTDAPSVEFDSAIVEISTVTLLPVEGDPIVITDAGGRFDLLQLQNGVTAELGDVDIPAGDYQELRLVVTSAHVWLAEPYEFEDGTTDRSLKVPSGAQSGIKVKLSSTDADSMVPFVSITEDAILVVDFDVSQNFKIQGNPETPAGLKGVLFTPVLRAVVRDVAGSISGTVTSSAEGNPGIAGLTVQATMEVNGDQIVATAVTDENGDYAISFLAPGTYEVVVQGFTPTDPATMPRSVEVGEGQDVTDVDFTGTTT